MQALLLITHPGTPLLLLPSHQFAPAPGATPAPTQPYFPGSLTLDPEPTGSNTLTVTTPPGLFTAPTLAIPGFPPELTNHLRALPGIWCVAIDPAGTILAEWPATNPGTTPEAVYALFPTPPTAPGTPAANGGALRSPSPYLAALSDGIITAALSHSWPPGHPQPSFTPAIHLGASVAAHILARVPVQPIPPGGGFFGAIAEPYTPPTQAESAQLSARKAAAINALRQVVINGQYVGKGLLGALDRGVSLDWGHPTPSYAPASATSTPHANYPAPPPCGWDMDTRTIFLAPTLHPDLDAPYLGAALYAAYGFQSGQATVPRLLVPAMFQSTPTALTPASITPALANEAARAWLLVAEITRALPSPSTAVQTLTKSPWGPPALAALPSQTLDAIAYEDAITIAVTQAAATLAPLLEPASIALHRETLATRDRWASPQTRANLPTPRPSIATTPAQSAPPAPSAKSPPPTTGHAYISPEVIITRETPPKVIYSVPTPARALGPLMIHIPPGDNFQTATLLFKREDGMSVYANNVPAADIIALRNAQSAILICALPNEDTSPPQAVTVQVL